jgi:hypothetical protein
LDVFVEFLCETLQTFCVLVDGADLCLKHDWLRRGRTDHFREPPEVGGMPGGLACIAYVVPQQKGFQTQLGRFEITESIFTSPAQIAHGFVFHLGDRDRREVSRAHQAGQLERIAAVCVDPIPGLFRDQRGSHDPAVIAFLSQIALEPISTRTRFVDKDKAFGL